ncbi:MAG: hypothetical protein OCD01_03025 [Fibrobacterales bacterium]
MKLLIMLLVTSLFLLSCSSAKRKDDYKTDELLITFNLHIQQGEYENAAQMLTPPERSKLMIEGVLSQQSIRGMKNLKISQLRKYEYFLDEQNKLIGLADVINGTAQKTKISQEQRKVKLHKRANASVQTDSLSHDSKRPQKVIEYNPYEDPNMNQITPKNDVENKVEIDGFLAPDQTTVPVQDTVIEPAEEPTLPSTSQPTQAQPEAPPAQSSTKAVAPSPEKKDSTAVTKEK